MKFENYLKEQGMYYVGIKDRKIIDTRHSVSRFLDRERFGDRAGQKDLLKDFLNVIRQGMRVILSKYRDQSGSYGVHSRSTQIGLVIEWRPDYKSQDSKNHAIIVSIFPMKSRHHFGMEDVVLIVEQIKKEIKDDGFRLILVN